MNFEEVGRQYVVLKERFENKQISSGEFERSVGELVAVAPDGNRWRLDPFAGTWVEMVPDGMPAAFEKVERGAPESLLQFISAFAKGLVKSLPKMIMIGLIMAILTWAAHTYVVAKVNDGLMYNASKVALNSVVHLQQTHFPGVNAFWGVLAYFLSSFIMRAHTLGPKKWFNSILLLPENIKQSMGRSRGKGLLYMVLGVFIALLFGLLFRNMMLSWILAFGILLVMTGHFESLETLVLKLALWDFQKLIKRKIVIDGEEYNSIFLTLLGMCAGFALVGIWRAKTIITFMGALLFLILFFVLMNKGKEAQKMAAFLIFIGGGALLLHPQTVYAWCEGASLSQVGGSWIDWWGSNNADLVRILGIKPAGSAFIGSILGSAAASFSSLGAGTAGTGAAQTATDDLSGGQRGIPPVITGGMGVPALQGSPGDNPSTAFEGGNGPGGCSRRGLPNYWVNTAILNLVVQDTVYDWTGFGPPVDLTLSYNSGSAAKRGMFGSGWSFTYDWLLARSNSAVTVSKGSGQSENFTLPNGAENTSLPVELIPPAGSYHCLLYYGDYWLYMAKGSRLIHRFDQVAGTEHARLTQISDYHGNTLQIGFDAHGHIGSIVDAAGRAVTFHYNEAGLCTAFILPDGRAASFGYDNAGNLSRAVDLLGVTSDYEYDAESCLTRMVVGREQKSTLFAYIRTGNDKRLAAVTDARGHVTSYEMIAADPVQVRVTKPEGKSVVYYSKDGLTEAVVDPLEHYIRYLYQNGMPVSFQDKNGGVTSIEYDTRGNMVSLTNPCGHTTICTYDVYDNRLTLTNSLGETWKFAYDEHHNLNRITTPLGKTQVMEYNQRGQLTSIVNTAGVKSSFAYDNFGNPAVVDYPLGKSTQLIYDQYGLTNVSRTDARGSTIFLDFDANGRLTGIKQPDGMSRTFGYNCCAGILTTDENGGSVVYERDPLLNITRYFDALGNATSYEYNRNNRLVRTSDALGRSMVIAYDDADQLVRIADPTGKNTDLHYDKKGNLVVLQEEGGQQISFTYDPCDRIIRITDMLNNSYSVERDPLGRISFITNGRGEKINFAYNQDGEIVEKQYDGAVVSSYEYDVAGNLSGVTDAAGRTLYLYNAARQVESVEYPDGTSISFAYDPAGNLTAVTYPGEVQVQYEYDSYNRLSSMTWENHYISFTFDGVGNLIGENRSNGVESVYSYNANYHLVGLIHGKAGEAFVDLQFNRDVVGNIIQEIGVKPFYDPWGDETNPESAATYNQANQLLTWNGDAYTYDADGNLISIHGAREYKAVYDPENMLVEMTVDGQNTYFTYNGLRQRVQSESGEQVAIYHYSPDGLLLFESDRTGRVTRRYLYSGDRLAAMIEMGGETCFYHFDHNGSTLALTDQEGEIVVSYAYSPFGAVVRLEGDLQNPFTYVGAWGVFDDGHDRFFMKNRYFDARTGRFTQKDPIGIAGGENLYAYVGNNPVNNIDPEGTVDPITITVGLFLIALGGAAYSVGKSAQNFGKKNPISRTLNAATSGDPNKNKEAHGSNPQAEFLYHPEHGLKQVVTTTGDKVLTLNPITAPAWSAGKGLKSALEGKPGDALLNAAGALPGNLGEAATAIGEVLDACSKP